MTGALGRGEGLRVRRGTPEQFVTRLHELPLPLTLTLRGTLAPTVALLETLDTEIRQADRASSNWRSPIRS